MPRGYDVYDQANIERRIIPPTDAIVGYNNLSLFIAGSGSQPTASILDISPRPKPLTISGGTRISYIQTDPYGTSNGVLEFFNGTFDTLTAAADTGYTFGSTGNFTISLWVNFKSTVGTFAPIITNWLNTSSGFNGLWFFGLNGGQVRWYDSAGNSAIADTSPATNTWINYAIVRSGSTITLYKNGISIGTQTTNQAYTNVGAVKMGFVTGGAYLNAFVYDVRVIKGTAVYTTNFPLPTQTQTMVQIGTAAWQLNQSNQQLWTPIQLSPAVWLDAADSGTILTVSGAVSQWSDKSGNNANATQGTAGQRPTYSASGLSGGYAGVVFDGLDDSLITLTTAINNTTHGIYWVFQRNGAGTGDAYKPEISVNTSTGADAGAIHYVKNSNNLGASYPYFNNAGFYDLSSGTAYVTGVPNIMAFQSNTTGWGVWRNGTIEGTSTGLAGASGVMNGLRLAQQQSPSRNSAITISEVLVVPNVNTSTRQLIEGYLAWKWGLVANLPANHPYKNSPPYTGYQSIFNQVVGVFSRFINRPPIIGDVSVLNYLFDPDAINYITAVQQQDGQNLEIDVQFAINYFVVGCKSDGIWDAIKSSCILAGARTLNGSLVPLKGAAPTNFNFVLADYNRKTGLLGDGSTKYLNSNRNNNADPQNNKHLSVYATQRNTEDTVRMYIGAVVGDGVAGDSQIFTTNTAPSKLLSRLNTSATNTSTGNLHASIGLYGITRNNGSNYTIRGSGTNETVSVASTTPNTLSTFVFARNFTGTFQSPIDGRLAFYSLGESINLALLDARVTQLINSYNSVIP